MRIRQGIKRSQRPNSKFDLVGPGRERDDVREVEERVAAQRPARVRGEREAAVADLRRKDGRPSLDPVREKCL